MCELQSTIYDTEQMKARVEILHQHIDAEAARINDLLRELQNDDYQPPIQLAKQNLEIQRKVKALSAKLPELQDRVAALAANTDSSHPTIADIARDEQEYLAVLARKKELDLQLASFQGLPSNPDMARSELEDLRGQLRSITSQRDAVFEGLVERESPVKRRR
jgi:HAUS augmin-like complex subunit 1